LKINDFEKYLLRVFLQPVRCMDFGSVLTHSTQIDVNNDFYKKAELVT